jgi:serine protease Do
MNKNQLFIFTVIAIASGIIGGILSILLVDYNNDKSTSNTSSLHNNTLQLQQGSTPIAPKESQSITLQEQFAKVANYATPAVVFITASKKVGVISGWDIFSGRRKIDYHDVQSGQGSGFFIRNDGIILTNYHVVKEQDSFIATLADNRQFNATVIGIDPPSDLAVLKLENTNNEKFPTLKFASLDSVQIGHWTIAIGAPLGLPRTVTVGVVSSKKRNSVGVNMYENYIQTDASINPGSSGGPLLNINGQVIGVNDLIMSPSGGNIGLSFAISSEIAEKAAIEMIKNGFVSRAWLGIIMKPIPPALLKKIGIDNGVLVENIFRNSPAQNKLTPGDIIIKANDNNITSPHTLRNTVFGSKINSNLVLTVLRNKQIIKVNISLTKAPRNFFNIQSNSNAISVRNI